MQNLIFLIFRYSAFLIFLLLEIISLYLIVNYNQSQKEIWANSSNIFSGNVQQKAHQFEDFFTQQQLNDSLLTENAKLLETIINYRVFSENNSFQTFELLDSDSLKSYSLIPSRVCSKTINLRNNYITLCAGKNMGVDVGMGVISKDGAVGIVKYASEDFATVMLLINGLSRISAMIPDKGYHGNLVWSSSDIRQMKLMDVPKHASISVGDTIVTSGYSISFPPHIHIGRVENFSIQGGSNNFDIDIELDYDLSTLKSVYVISYDNLVAKDSILVSQYE